MVCETAKQNGARLDLDITGSKQAKCALSLELYLNKENPSYGEGSTLKPLDGFTDKVEPLTRLRCLEEFHDYLTKNFRKIDSNKDNRIDDNEMKAVVESDGKLPFSYEPAVQHIFRNWSNDEVGTELGITKNDLMIMGTGIQEYKNLRTAQKDAIPDYYRMTNFALANFGSLDANHDGRIASNDLILDLARETNPTKRAYMEYMLKDFKIFGDARREIDFELNMAAMFETKVSTGKVPRGMLEKTNLSRTSIDQLELAEGVLKEIEREVQSGTIKGNQK